MHGVDPLAQRFERVLQFRLRRLLGRPPQFRMKPFEIPQLEIEHVQTSHNALSKTVVEGARTRSADDSHQQGRPEEGSGRRIGKSSAKQHLMRAIFTRLRALDSHGLPVADQGYQGLEID